MWNPFSWFKPKSKSDDKSMSLDYRDVQKVWVKGTISVEFTDGSSMLFTDAESKFDADSNTFSVTYPNRHPNPITLAYANGIAESYT